MPAPLTQINGYAHVAERYGFEEAVFLDSIMYWYRANRANGRNFRDGRWWTYNSIKALEEIFPWWSAKQIRRIAASCREQGAIIAGEFNEDRRDRSLWYTPGGELLELYGFAGDCICPNGQVHLPERADSFAQMGECNIRNTCNNHDGTNMNPPIVPPEGGSAPSDPKTGAPIEAQRSGFDGERRHSGADELSPQGEARDAQLVPTKDKPAPKAGRSARRFVPPDVEQVRAYCRERQNSIDPEAFVNYYASKGWTVGRAPMKDWKAAVRTWEQRRRTQGKETSSEDDWFQ